MDRMYRRGTTKRRHTLGTYPELYLADAREQPAEAQHAVQFEKIDPAAAKKAERAETFAELSHLYIERRAKREQRWWRKDVLILEKDLLPRFGNRKAIDITRRDINEMLDQIVDRGAP